MTIDVPLVKEAQACGLPFAFLLAVSGRLLVAVGNSIDWVSTAIGAC